MNMTVFRALNPRNLLLVICMILLVLIGFKGYYIVKKIDGYNQAEQLYANKQWIEAEAAYDKAHRNRWIHYKEQQLTARLTELAPIAEIRSTLERIRLEAVHAAEELDFSAYKEIVHELQQFRAAYMGQGHPFEQEYIKISEQLQVSPMIIKGWNDFRGHFTQQMADNLENKQYEEESFRGYLMSIPDMIYGSSEKKTAAITEQLKAYDERKLAQLGAAGNTDALLQASLAMSSSYQALQFEAPWVRQKIDDIIAELLSKAAEQVDYAMYIHLAKQYEQHLTSLQVSESAVKNAIDRQIQQWLKQGGRLVQAGEYEDAITLYKSLAAYTDTSELLKQAQLEQMASDPIRLLQQLDHSVSYEHVMGGKNRFGGKLYAAGISNGEQLVVAVWSGKEHVKRYLSDQIPASTLKLQLEPKLGSDSSPALIIESASTSRTSKVTAYQLHSDGLRQLLQFEGDRYEIVNSGHIKVYHPEGSRDEKAVADYKLKGGQFEFAGYEERILDIEPAELTSHLGAKVRMKVNIVQVNEQMSLAEVAEGQYIGLVGQQPQSTGLITVVGQMNQYTDIRLDDAIIVVPVFEVESIE
ncbi:hypothetical protein [Paenibacillus aquistagni]|uniref:hypothetical protein n=1 Tax=Paenibacillus aquistagni TaxID=1852522 RepID=UPI00113209F3|nr:hypothetical protein [Paenibacillus aquistagni]